MEKAYYKQFLLPLHGTVAFGISHCLNRSFSTFVRAILVMDSFGTDYRNRDINLSTKQWQQVHTVPHHPQLLHLSCHIQ